MGELGARQRQVLIPFAAGFSYQEIAAATGLSPRAIERTLKRARRRLRADLGFAPEMTSTPTASPESVAAA